MAHRYIRHADRGLEIIASRANVSKCCIECLSYTMKRLCTESTRCAILTSQKSILRFPALNTKNGVFGCHPAFSSGQRAITVPPSHIFDTLDTLTGALRLSPPEPAFQNASLNVYCWVRHHLRLQIHRQPKHK